MSIQQICVSRRALLKGAVASAGAGILASSRLAQAGWPASSFSPYYFDSGGVSTPMHTAIQAALPQWIAAITWTPTGEWLVVSGSGVIHKSSNFPADCFNQVSSYIAAGDRINCVAFRPDGRWVVVTELNAAANGIPNDCWNDISARFAAGQEITCVAFTSGSGWAVLSDSMGPSASGIPGACVTALQQAAGNAGTWPEHVVFGPSNSWAVLGRGTFVGGSTNFPLDCWDKMMDCRNVQGRRVTHVAFSPSGAWHVSGNDFITMPAPTGGLAAVRNIMTTSGIPGVQVAMVQNNVITRLDNYGTVHRGSNFPVTSSTRFQAASVSKVVSSGGVFRAIQNGLIPGLSIDSNIRANLNVVLPGVGTTGSVRLRQILSHQAGFNVSGFGGYRRPPGAPPVPNTLGIITGAGNSPAIARTLGTGDFNYSGGGFVLIQRLIEVASGQTFPDWMWTNLLSPIGMSASRFRLEPTWVNGDLATGHGPTSFPSAHRRHIFPEFAAAGLYTTANDLARFLITINRRGIAPNNTTIWSNSLGVEMLKRQTDLDDPTNFGLGVFRGKDGASGQSYWHNGGNVGFNTYVWGNPVLNNGVVVLTNYESASPTPPVISIANQYISQFAL